MLWYIEQVFALAGNTTEYHLIHTVTDTTGLPSARDRRGIGKNMYALTP